MNSIKQKFNPLISAKKAKRLVACLVFIFIFESLLFPPAPALASENNKDIINKNTNQENNILMIEEVSTAANIENEVTLDRQIEEKNLNINFLPKNEDIKTINSDNHVITAYNSEVGQCDDSPCITANGFNVCEHGIEDTIAANWLKFGTKVRIPELFGDRIFIVRDRMNKRFPDHVDIWFKSKAEAIKFGRKVANIEVLEP